MFLDRLNILDSDLLVDFQKYEKCQNLIQFEQIDIIVEHYHMRTVITASQNWLQWDQLLVLCNQGSMLFVLLLNQPKISKLKKLIVIMSKNILDSYQRINPYKYYDKPSSKIQFKQLTSKRRVQTEAFDPSEEDQKYHTKNYQFSISNYKNYLPSKSQKISNPFPKLQYKRQTYVPIQKRDPQITSTINRNTAIKLTKEPQSRSKPTLVNELLAGKIQNYKKHTRVRTEVYDQTTKDKISEIYSKLNKITIGKEKKDQKDPEKKYKVIQTIGKGTFGVVYKAMELKSGEVVAIKKVLQDKRYKNRQLQIMKMLHHPNLLQTKDYYYTQSGGQQYLNVVIDYFQQNLYNFNRSFHRKGEQIPSLLIKIYAYQMFKSINYLRALSIAHRDIKPHNILVDPKNNKLVICDFGSAKQLVANQPNLAYICSRCYRAPELIYGATDYSPQIDMWSIGCVIVEMINGQPPFMGDSQIDQLIEILKVLGTPSKTIIMQMNKNYDMKEYKYPSVNAKQWRKILKAKTDPLLVDLVTKVMQYSPSRRLTPFEAMCHPYFDDIRIQQKHREIVMLTGCRDLLDFGKQQILLQEDFQQKLVPGWYK